MRLQGTLGTRSEVFVSSLVLFLCCYHLGKSSSRQSEFLQQLPATPFSLPFLAEESSESAIGSWCTQKDSWLKVPIAKKPARDGQTPGATGTQQSWDHGGGAVCGRSCILRGRTGPPHGSNAPCASLLLPSGLLLQLLLIELYWKTEGEGAPVMQLKASLGRC